MVAGSGGCCGMQFVLGVQGQHCRLGENWASCDAYLLSMQ
jgi:hypothetical protein